MVWGGPLYGPANPSGMFNIRDQAPHDEPLAEIELGYEGLDRRHHPYRLGGRFGKHKMFGYRTNLLLADGRWLRYRQPN